MATLARRRARRAMPRGTSVAGQGLQRREILRVIGVASLASHFPGFSALGLRRRPCARRGRATRPKSYALQFFSEPDFAVIGWLTELIIPSDETPGAREAGVCEFVDFMVAHDPEQQAPMRTGLAWLQNRSQRRIYPALSSIAASRTGGAARAPCLQGKVSRRRRNRTGILPPDSRTHGDGLLLE